MEKQIQRQKYTGIFESSMNVVSTKRWFVINIHLALEVYGNDDIRKQITVTVRSLKVKLMI